MDLNLDAGMIRLALLDLLIAIISFTVHEWGHAKMADRLGDDTPRSQGRVTLNPIPHIDILGTIIVPLLASFGFFGDLRMIGWAKPVITNARNLKNRTDEALVTLAGPAMNVLLALIATVLAALCARMHLTIVPLLLHVVGFNILLVVFNLLPIPPLDGSKFLIYWFGMSEETYLRYSQWGGFLLLGLLFFKRAQLFFLLLQQIAALPFVQLFDLLTR